MRFFVFFLLVPLALAAQQPLTATLKIDIDRRKGEVDSLLWGSFVEHLGRSTYGGVYDPKSKQADAQGFRSDVAEATKQLGVTHLRWPGGNFVSGYRWTDGIGPKKERPVTRDLAWFANESNQVGTDEFLQWSKRLNVAPVVCVNMGTGTLDEARSWVEYCNGPLGTHWADLRAKNGHPDPYRVKFWGLGNEMDGEWQMGHKNAEDYGKFALEAAKLMKWTDPTIQLVAVGSSDWTQGKWIDWNRTVLRYLKHHADYIALHMYTGNRDKNHLKYMALTTEYENRIRIVEGLINEARATYNLKKPIYIAVDEYNVWYRGTQQDGYEERYNLQDAMQIAGYLNLFVRNAHVVKMANLAQLVNVIAPIFVENDKMWRQTTYYPFQLFAQHSRTGTSLDHHLSGPTYDAGEYRAVPYLDVSTVYRADTRELVINVLNRHPEQAIETTILNQTGTLTGPLTVYEVNGSALTDENSVAGEKVKTVQKSFPTSGNVVRYRFPAHSVTVLKGRVTP